MNDGRKGCWGVACPVNEGKALISCHWDHKVFPSSATAKRILFSTCESLCPYEANVSNTQTHTGCYSIQKVPEYVPFQQINKPHMSILEVLKGYPLGYVAGQ